ncbi:MAG: peptidylprolyl isomerase [Oscillospiraceae bacterium]|nr:peptidylprolyl isomerase [Oscillospiraceae bacterium]
MKKTIKILSITFLMLVMVMVITACGNNNDEEENEVIGESMNPVVSMEIEGHGTVKIELYVDMAPETVKNFISLINEGYYDGLTFHRIDQSLNIIQGGDWAGDGTGDTDYSVRGEFRENGFRANTLRFERGVVGLARRDFTGIAHEIGVQQLIEEGYNSGFAQFFIMTGAQPNFNGRFTAFGRVVEGMDIVDELQVVPVGEMSRPIDPPVISRMTVDTFGVEFREPELHRTFDINAFFEETFGL